MAQPTLDAALWSLQLRVLNSLFGEPPKGLLKSTFVSALVQCLQAYPPGSVVAGDTPAVHTVLFATSDGARHGQVVLTPSLCLATLQPYVQWRQFDLRSVAKEQICRLNGFTAKSSEFYPALLAHATSSPLARAHPVQASAVQHTEEHPFY